MLNTASYKSEGPSYVARAGHLPTAPRSCGGRFQVAEADPQALVPSQLIHANRLGPRGQPLAQVQQVGTVLDQGAWWPREDRTARKGARGGVP